MTLGEPVVGEASDLLEAPLRRLRRVAVRQHAADELVPEPADRSHPAERRDRAAQVVGLLRREARPHDGDPHRLLLEQRHAEGARRDLLEGRAERLGPLESLAAPDVGLHHAALDRARADDGDLDHQIVECLRLHARQEAHLRPALHLKHPDGVRPLQHLVGGRILLRHAGDGQSRAPVALDQLERLADAGEHAQPENVDLEDPERGDVVLVPLDDGAILHRRVLDRAQLVQPPPRDHKPADMLSEMARKPHDLADQPQRLREPRLVRIQPGLPDQLRVGARIRRPPHPARQPGGGVPGEAHRPAHLADRGAGAEARHGGAESGAVAPVALVDPLDDLLAPLVLEVDVDVRRLAPVLRDEPLEDHRDAVGADLGDPEQVAQDRVARRPPALAENAARPRLADDVVDGQEIRGEAQLGHHREFLVHQLQRLPGGAAGIAPPKALPRQPLEPHLRGLALKSLVGVLVAELVQAEPALRRNLQRPPHGGGMRAEHPLHVPRRPEAALRVRQGAGPERVDGCALADAGEDVGQPPAGGAVHQGVSDRHHRGGGAVRKPGAGREAARIRPVVARRGPEEDAAGEAAGDVPDLRLGAVRIAPGQRDQDHAAAALRHVAGIEKASALAGPALAERQQPGQAVIRRPVARQRDPVRRGLPQRQPGSDDQPGQLPARCASLRRLPRKLPQRAVGAHHPRQRVAVGDGDRLEAQLGGPRRHLLGMRRPGEKGEVGGGAQFRVAHANSPCTCHAGRCGVRNIHSRRPSRVSTIQ